MSSEARPLPRPLVAAASVDRAEWLIDNADAYAALVSAIRHAHDFIWISQLALDADCEAYGVGSADGTTTIVGELLAASRRGVAVRVLLNASLLLDTAKPLRAHLEKAGADARRFRVRGVSRFPQLLHAKLVLVDAEVALLIGSPFANGYWDDARHAPVDHRRPMRELAGRPVHDVSTRITGPSVATFSATFAALWNDAEDTIDGDEEDLVVAGHPTALTDSPMRIVRTAPGHGPMEILPALLEGIAGAEWLVYIEHQYLSARPVVDALVQALARRRTLEVVVLLNQNPDVTAYRGWQNARLRESGLLEHPRVGLFTLWTSAVEAGRQRRQLNQVFVHSKVVAIDDRWLLVGSANLDGVSLHSYGDDFSSRLGRRIFRGVRNFDVGAIIDVEDGGDALEQVRSLRARLWKEHLGGSFHEIGARPREGWLPLWRSVARRNAAELGKGRRAHFLDGPFILPYSTRSTPRAQLADVGV
ncbi:MAG TPA: phosphatidylserine/phosphatidylglycerophosphate/cardiolipin synthase family protein, partial [Gemmatimonadaceae bacterium]|nr:phosphatidylserine/phosphatidylglycerophosphate/cardiolipin synthase family protein [Gemmatimonadaceae bacterium]